jgi:hypothetical protein
MLLLDMPLLVLALLPVAPIKIPWQELSHIWKLQVKAGGWLDHTTTLD